MMPNPLNPEILPRKLSSLDQPGVRKLLEIAKSSPALARLAADGLASDPRGTIDRLFRLSDAQRASINNTPDEDLQQRLATAIALLRAGAFDTDSVLFDPGRASAPGVASEFARSAGSPNELKIKCDCHIEIS